MEPNEQRPVAKPPLGILPRWLWLEQRIIALTEAMQRYADAGQPVPPDWVKELRELTEWRFATGRE